MKGLERIGVFGGTFDPPHLGHLILAEMAREQLRLDRLLFLPAGRSPLKPEVKMASDHHRSAMLDLALAHMPEFELDLTDLERPSPSYTVDTLALLREAYGPEPEFFLLIGEDSLVDFPRWRAPEQIIDAARLAVFDRPGFRADLDTLEDAVPGIRNRIERIEGPRIGISATGLRQRIRQGRSIRFQVPWVIESYLQEQGLYRAGVDEDPARNNGT